MAGAGGALYVGPGGKAFLCNATFRDNGVYECPDGGAAIWIDQGAELVLLNATIVQNLGGGIHAEQHADTKVYIVNSLVTGNCAHDADHDRDFSFECGVAENCRADSCLFGKVKKHLGTFNTMVEGIAVDDVTSAELGDILTPHGVEHVVVRVMGPACGMGVKCVYDPDHPFDCFGYYSGVLGAREMVQGAEVNAVDVDNDEGGDPIDEPLDSELHERNYSIGAVYTEPGFVFELENAYGKGKITGFYGTLPAKLMVPRFAQGLDIAEIGHVAFRGNLDIERVVLSDGLEKIEATAFFGCEAIESFEVDEHNTMFCSYRNVLYTSDKSELICYPSAKTFVEDDFPVGLSILGEFAFGKNLNLVDIVLPDTVVRIKDYAFDSCFQLRTVTIPNSAVRIDRFAFSGDNYMESVRVLSPDASKCHVGWECYDDTDALLDTFFRTDGALFNNYPCAYWKPVFSNKRILTFAPGEGTVTPATQEVGVGLDLTIGLPTPVRQWYVFNGWFGDPEGTTGILAAMPDRDYTVYAKWSPDFLQVVYDANGGAGAPPADMFIFGSNFHLSSDTGTLSRPGYTFLGWHPNPRLGASETGPKFPQDTLATADCNYSEIEATAAGETKTVYAIWSANGYKLAYNPNGAAGSAAISNLVYDAEAQIAGCEFVRPGYAFAGWNTRADGTGDDYAGTVSNLTETADATVDLYAQWQLIDYPITYHLDGGENAAANPPSYTIESDLITLDAPTKAGYTFTGWTPAGTIAAGSTGPKEFTANWEAGTTPAPPSPPPSGTTDFTVEFDSEGGTAVAPQTVADGGRAVRPADPEKSGYAFRGWYLDAAGTMVWDFNTPISGNVVLHAKWSMDIPAPVPGMCLVVFYSDAARTAVLYACNVNENSHLSWLPNPVAPVGYGFEGWFENGASATAAPEEFTTSTVVSRAYELVPRFTALRYTLAYDANGGTGTMPDQELEYDAEGNVADCGFVRDGYGFTGWNTAADGTGTGYAAGVVVSNLATTAGAVVKFYAQWTETATPLSPPVDPDRYTLTLDANGGAMADSAAIAVTAGSPIGQLPTPELRRYDFAGWYLDDALIGPATVWTWTTNLTAVAHWRRAAPQLFQNADLTPCLGDITYNGWLRDADGSIKGLLTVKAAKPKNGLSKLTITYTPAILGAKKQSIKGYSAMLNANGPASVDVRELGVTLYLGGEQLFAADGSVQSGFDGLKSKDRTVKAATALTMAGFQGMKAFAFTSPEGNAAFSLKIDKKGKGKLAGTLPDGTKVSLSSQGVLGKDLDGNDQLALPFVLSKKACVGFVFWIHSDGELEVSDLTEVKLANGAALPVDGAVAGEVGAFAIGPHVFKALDFVQDFTCEGKKWNFGKHDKNLPEGLDPNRFSTKLSFNAKTGQVKGSFVYPRNSNVKYTVVGNLVETADGSVKFYGAATLKKPILTYAPVTAE